MFPACARTSGRGKGRFEEARGAAEFELDVDTKTLRWILTYQDLSSPPTKVTLHAPAQPGATGAAI